MIKLLKNLGLYNLDSSIIKSLLAFLAFLLFIGLNYMSLILPNSIFVVILLVYQCYSTLALTSFAYWLVMDWTTLLGDKKNKNAIGIFILTLLYLMTTSLVLNTAIR
jgi:hypothetical protein